jgi:hypothetical protein
MYYHWRNQPGVKVRELVEHLLKGDQEAEVVALDHFGRPLGVTLEDFIFMKDKTSNYLTVSPIDIGPEPD